MRSFLFSLVIVLGITAGVGAAYPPVCLAPSAPALTFRLSEFTVSGASEVGVGQRVVLSPDHSEGCSVTWLAIDGEDLISKRVQTDIPREIINDDLEFELLPKSSLVFKAKAAGKIRFICTAYSPERFAQVIHTITVSGKKESDQDGEGDQGSDEDTPPKPQPDPDLQVYDEVWLVLIDESADRAVSNKIINSVKLDEFCKSRKFQKSEYDKDDPKIPRGYLPVATETGLPSFILSGVKDGGNEMLVNGKFPGTAEELIQKIEGYKVK